MKKVVFYVGIVICLIGLVPLLRYVLDYSELSNYGRGYIWGKVLIIFVGLFIVLISSRLKNSK